MITVERHLERFAESKGGAAPVARDLALPFRDSSAAAFASARFQIEVARNYPNSETSSPVSLRNFLRFSHIRFSNRELAVRSTSRDSGVRFLNVAGTGSSSRATPSHLPVTNHYSPLTTHYLKGGTLNRPSARVSHRKHSPDAYQGRNIPVHFKYSLLPSPRLRQRAMVTFP
jgi:hypothetical protein